jgi:hypothetical protein
MRFGPLAPEGPTRNTAAFPKAVDAKAGVEPSTYASLVGNRTVAWAEKDTAPTSKPKADSSLPRALNPSILANENMEFP